MKLYYFQDPRGNFGDDLNPWLWGRLLPELSDFAPDALFVGIGTLINHRLPENLLKHIFGSGLGYGNSPVLDRNFVVHAVRGHKTARALGLPSAKVVTDSALLIRTVLQPVPARTRSRIGVMLTGESIDNFDWHALCSELGFQFISCHWSVERILDEIVQCEVLLSEAMHGAIVADALRIPWIPLKISDNVLDFKWQDWLSTLELPYSPVRITSLFDREGSLVRIQRLNVAIKRGLRGLGIWSASWTPPVPRNSSDRDRDRAMAELEAATHLSPFLSRDSLVMSLTDRYVSLLEDFRRSYLQRLDRPTPG